jgi:phage terminase large subunit GpA-like protein
MSNLKDQIKDIFSGITVNKFDMLPSEYAEKNRILGSDISSLQGPFNYNYTPYLREVVDTLSPYHPARVVAVMKGAQIGYSEV